MEDIAGADPCKHASERSSSVNGKEFASQPEFFFFKDSEQGCCRVRERVEERVARRS